MNIKRYIKDNIINISIYIITLIILFLFFRVLKLSKEAVICTYSILCLMFFIIFTYNYYRKKFFYQDFNKKLDKLDKKYIITELINRPDFLEGEILYNALYEIDKSMNEKIKEYRISLEELKEYIELWIHEVKIPVSSILLMAYKNDQINKVIDPTKKIENLVEQVLYYARSENTEKDYLIKECNLGEIVNNVIKRNKETFILRKINLKIENLTDIRILTDAKWLEFILNQIINNSLKYLNKNISNIKISCIEKEENTILNIYDNGIGIPETDIKRVFEKSFTGENGRQVSTSTGMGLYICKKLCNTLGHGIEIQSEQGKYTMVSIIFHKEEFYNIMKHNNNSTRQT